MSQTKPSSPEAIHKAKMQAAEAALQSIEPWLEKDTVLGIGTGSTTRCFIELLGGLKTKIKGAVASSIDSENLLKEQGIELLDLNSVGTVPYYIDGADEFDPDLNLIKGGGAALTREKIIAACAKEFLCIVDESKQVNVLGKFPLPIEVIPMARSYVGRELVKLKANPSLREGVVTDNGNHIIDAHGLSIGEPLKLEQTINNITGTVCAGLFAHRRADKVFMACASGVRVLEHD